MVQGYAHTPRSRVRAETRDGDEPKQAHEKERYGKTAKKLESAIYLIPQITGSDCGPMSVRNTVARLRRTLKLSMTLSMKVSLTGGGKLEDEEVWIGVDFGLGAVSFIRSSSLGAAAVVEGAFGAGE